MEQPGVFLSEATAKTRPVPVQEHASEGSRTSPANWLPPQSRPNATGGSPVESPSKRKEQERY